MKKNKQYKGIRFDSIAFSAADKAFRNIAGDKIQYIALQVEEPEDVEWRFDKFQEFLAACDKGPSGYSAISSDLASDATLTSYSSALSIVSVAAKSRDEIEHFFQVVEEQLDRCKYPRRDKRFKIFIGHGHNSAWRDLKDHLQDKHKYMVEAYEIGSRAGLTIEEVLKTMLDKSSIALLVMTGEDKMRNRQIQARQNVVHELGLFQGRLGFHRAIILLEEGTAEFSNISGTQQLRFSKGKIVEIFGDVVAALSEAEMGPNHF